MGVDGKYGRVTTEFGTIGEDEPVIVFRAQDKLLPAVLEFYAALCGGAGSPTGHVGLVQGARERVLAWQAEHHTQIPNSATYYERIGESK